MHIAAFNWCFYLALLFTIAGIVAVAIGLWLDEKTGSGDTRDRVAWTGLVSIIIALVLWIAWGGYAFAVLNASG